MNKTLETLEYPRILEMLADCAQTESARLRAGSLTPSPDIQEVLKRQRYTTDAQRLLNQKGKPPFGNGRAMEDICSRAEKGGILSCQDLLNCADLLKTARGLREYITTDHLFDTSLDEFFMSAVANQHLEDKILQSILSPEMVADEASPALADIRRKIRIENNRVKEVLQKYITNGSYSKYLQEAIVTTRDGRYVIPVKAECKNEVRGLIHDTSSSGATFFIEPMAVVEANNELKSLENKEQREIERILYQLSLEVADIVHVLRLDYDCLAEISFSFACAELSCRMGACPVKVSGDRTIHLSKARHPLIPKERMVPIDIFVEGYDTMIITGPNTGGKTVTMKTLGLLSLMFQSGLHIPVAEDSEICIFDNVLVDIGDDQSIEQSLSTFSSHMVNIVEIMQQVGSRSLVLLDELGVGTDPVEGAALAISIIEAIRKKKAICLATTHYAELKMYALETEGVRNASCEFDVDTLQPTYKLVIGSPGKSNAFAISRKLGLPGEIVDRASQYVSSDNKRFEQVIEKLEIERVHLEKEREEMNEMRTSYEKFKEISEKQLKDQLSKAETVLSQARDKAQSMVESARISSQFVFDQMEKVKKAKESGHLSEELEAARKAVRSHLRENEEKFNPVENRQDEDYRLPRPLKKGDRVYLNDIRKEGYVTEAPAGDTVFVQIGIMKTKTKLGNLRLVEDTSTEQYQKAADKIQVSAAAHFRPEIDLRGMNGEEAWLAVDKYLDDAGLVGVNTVSLIHGKGTGALKKALWTYLRGDRRVTSFRIGNYGEGDGGVTVVTLK